jgi:PleD family two-component response regulator
MTQPLALVIYEKLLPGSQVVNRLQDLNYRVQALNEARMLVQCAEQTKPMLVLADLESTQENICATLALLKQNPATKHLPIIGFRGDSALNLDSAAQAAGVSLIVSETAILNHLPQILDQALQVD